MNKPLTVEPSAAQAILEARDRVSVKMVELEAKYRHLIADIDEELERIRAARRANQYVLQSAREIRAALQGVRS